MPTKRGSPADPARTLQLLWRERVEAPRRGPQRGLDVDGVVVAATDLADREGLAAVTMRRVAQALGVGAMTLYTYVPGRAELIDLMLDAAYARMPRADTAGQPWRARMAAVAEENRALFEAHPWAATLSASRPPLGPGLIAKYDHELAALDGLGRSDVDMDACLTYLLGFVQSCARAAADARAVQVDSALSDEQWWAANARLLARVFDGRDYPLAVRVGTTAGAAQGGAYNADHAYQFGLARTLDGLAAFLDSR